MTDQKVSTLPIGPTFSSTTPSMPQITITGEKHIKKDSSFIKNTSTFESTEFEKLDSDFESIKITPTSDIFQTIDNKSEIVESETKSNISSSSKEGLKVFARKKIKFSQTGNHVTKNMISKYEQDDTMDIEVSTSSPHKNQESFIIQTWQNFSNCSSPSHPPTWEELKRMTHPPSSEFGNQ